MFLGLIKARLQAPEGDGGSGGTGGSGAGNGGGSAGAGADGASGSGGGSGGSSGDGGLFDDGKGADGSAGGQGAGATGNGGADGKGGNGDGSGASKAVIPENWKEALPPELKDAPFMSKYKDVASLAKAHSHLEAMLGKDKIVIPQKGSSPEVMRAEVFQKLGLPADVKDYKIDVKADGPKVDAEFTSAFAKEAYERNILPEQAQGMLQWFAEMNDKGFKAGVAAQVESQRTALASLKSEWGQAYDQNITLAKAGMKEFLSPEEQAHFKQSGLGTDPAFIKLMNKLGGTLNEAQIKGAGGTGQGGNGALSPQQAQSAIDAIKKDMNHAYYDKNHADHAAAKREVNRLYGMRFGNSPAVGTANLTIEKK